LVSAAFVSLEPDETQALHDAAGFFFP